ncbi:MAG TPA: R3H domain-containing nucleic acid-binding protein [Microbacteriaceae bacterium]|nr:R3H domain-containing nucleic acid-binding protein [Microbacteriaceae bacterium]
MTEQNTQVASLDAEGEFAADYIEELLDIADLDGDLDIAVKNDRVYLTVDSSTDDLVALSKPDVVAALQELTRAAVLTGVGNHSRLILDIAGSRSSRERELEQLVERASTRIAEGAREVALPPMSSYERKLVHDLVFAQGLTSESRGEGRDRHTVVLPK